MTSQVGGINGFSTPQDGGNVQLTALFVTEFENLILLFHVAIRKREKPPLFRAVI